MRWLRASMSDFDGTLYFLDEREIEYLQTEVDREYRADLRQNVVSILLDIYILFMTPFSLFSKSENAY